MHLSKHGCLTDIKKTYLPKTFSSTGHLGQDSRKFYRSGLDFTGYV